MANVLNLQLASFLMEGGGELINKECAGRSMKFSTVKYRKRAEKLWMEYCLWVQWHKPGDAENHWGFRRRFNLQKIQIFSIKFLTKGTEKTDDDDDDDDDSNNRQKFILF
jgi:hypothetical protein